MSVSPPIFRALLPVHGLSTNIVRWRGGWVPCFTRMLTDCGEEYHVCEARGTGTRSVRRRTASFKFEAIPPLSPAGGQGPTPPWEHCSAHRFKTALNFLEEDYSAVASRKAFSERGIIVRYTVSIDYLLYFLISWGVPFLYRTSTRQLA
jgi:hypothetical protein